MKERQRVRLRNLESECVWSSRKGYGQTQAMIKKGDGGTRISPFGIYDLDEKSAGFSFIRTNANTGNGEKRSKVRCRLT